MKMRLMPLTLCMIMGAGAGVFASTNEFPFHVPFELGETEFAPGDNLTIQEVRGTKETIEPGGTYCITGTYRLASKDEADLAVFATTLRSVAVPTDSTQIVRIEKGEGTFRLIKPMREEGYLHVSFYPAPSGSSFGGVYFGQGKWVLRQKGHVVDRTERSGARPAPSGAVALEGANRALFEYLGAPVAPPANLDPAYTKAGLIQAVQNAAQNAGISLKQIDIDDSEFPFLVGVRCAEGDYPKLTAQLKKLSAYDYGGSVGSSTCNAMNLVPYRAMPADITQRVSHRMTLRMQVLQDTIKPRR